MIEPYKFLIQPVAIERDESGRIVAERVAEIVTVFSAEQAAEAVHEFVQALIQITEEGGNQNGSDQHADRDAVGS